MKDYVILMTLTESGAGRLKELPVLAQAWMDDWAKNCGRLDAFRATLGGLDFVLLGQAPEDEVAASYALRLTMGGLVKTTSLRAFAESSLKRLLQEATNPSGRGIV